MTAGEQDETPFTGVLEVVGDEDSEWPSMVRVFKDRERYRVEDLDGSVLTIHNLEHTFAFRSDEDYPHDHGVPIGVPSRHDNEPGSTFHPGAYGHLIARRDPTDWRGDDFTTPTGPARAMTYLGRAAWEVELAPPAHKPSPLVIVVDAITGMTYEQRSIQFGLLSRWREIEPVESHPNALFEWDGDVHTFFGGSFVMSDDEESDWQRERAERAAALGVGPLELTVRAEVHPHEADDDGAFFASIEARVDGVLLRRPTSAERWEPDINYPHEQRWSDDTWDWCVASDGSVEHLTQIRRQLAEPRPEHG